jgi:hypothetical protein
MNTTDSSVSPALLSSLQTMIGPATFIACNGKKPIRKQWQNLRPEDMTGAYLQSLCGNNVGVSLGAASNGLVTVDFDDDAAAKAFVELNSALRRTFRTRGRRGYNFWLRVRGELPKSLRLVGPEGESVGEWRATGNQTIIAGIHPDTQTPYRIMVAEPPVEIDVGDISWPPCARPTHWPLPLHPPNSPCDVEHIDHADDPVPPEQTEQSDHSPESLQPSTALVDSTPLHPTGTLHGTCPELGRPASASHNMRKQ